jgi:hypothetical protein
MKTTQITLTIDNKQQKTSNTLSADKGTPEKTNKTQQRLANISKKLGLSFAVFQR